MIEKLAYTVIPARYDALRNENEVRTMYSIFCPAISVGRISIAFLAAMPSDAAGPVREILTPILTCADALDASKRAPANEIVAQRYSCGDQPQRQWPED
ncbi:MAG: hypothetical protein JO289_02010 [Xanthobacteraceae bacterium]|nr:hypothetical protein [Xanthobacteraceae bacterium]